MGGGVDMAVVMMLAVVGEKVELIQHNHNLKTNHAVQTVANDIPSYFVTKTCDSSFELPLNCSPISL